MENMHFVGLDVHKKIIAFCVKQVDGKIISQGTIDANRRALANSSSPVPLLY